MYLYLFFSLLEFKQIYSSTIHKIILPYVLPIIYSICISQTNLNFFSLFVPFLLVSNFTRLTYNNGFTYLTYSRASSSCSSLFHPSATACCYSSQFISPVLHHIFLQFLFFLQFIQRKTNRYSL